MACLWSYMSLELKDSTFDAVIIGTGIGGSTFAYGLARRGLSVAVIERGDYLTGKPGSLDPVNVFYFENRPVVGGQTKAFGAAMYRLREMDFRATQMESGVSPGWPISYADLESYYGEAEKLFRVHGSSVNDATEPSRSVPWPHPPVPHQGPVKEFVARVTERAGVPVSYIPRAIDFDPQHGGKCVLCRRCDAYYCPRDAKMDAEIAALRPAVSTGKVTLFTKTDCVRVLTSADGKRVAGVRVRRDGVEATFSAPKVAVSCGLVDTPMLLWRSRTDQHPRGLSNASGALGRNWAAHTQAWIFPIALGVQRQPFHQKTFAINAYYESGPDSPYPMGVIQAAGNIEPIALSRRHRYFAQVLLQHSFQTFVMTEALPSMQTGFALSDDGAKVIAEPVRNVQTFARLRARATDIFRSAGYRVFAPAREMTYHSVGTARMGTDASNSVVDANCHSHEIDGLYVVDSSVLPSSGALNSGLTVAAVALRAAAAASLPA
jgi:choline dehydrogenase-like flavoprotein